MNNYLLYLTQVLTWSKQYKDSTDNFLPEAEILIKTLWDMLPSNCKQECKNKVVDFYYYSKITDTYFRVRSIT